MSNKFGVWQDAEMGSRRTCLEIFFVLCASIFFREMKMFSTRRARRMWLSCVCVCLCVFDIFSTCGMFSGYLVSYIVCYMLHVFLIRFFTI